MRRNVMIALAVVAFVVVLYVVVQQAILMFQGSGAASDEAPIRVKNGSMDIQISRGVWRRDGSDYVYSDPSGHNRGQLWMLVTNRNSNTVCGPDHGHVVTVKYQDGDDAYSVDFGTRSFAGDNHTWVPQAGLIQQSDQHLSHGTPGHGGITAVLVDGSLKCTIGSDFDEVRICSASTTPECKQK